MMPAIRLSLLGSFAITREQQPIQLTIGKIQALLAYLAVTRVPQTREHLLSFLWAESHPDAARKNLRNRLWQLRQHCGEEVVVTLGDRLALAPAVWTDVATFETGIQAQLQRDAFDADALAALLALWRGPLLADVRLTEAPDFELWLTTERERLGQLYLSGLQTLLADQQRRADWSQVITLAQRGLAYDPLQEPLYQAMMLAYAHQGARTEALRQYDRLRTLLAQELGVQPLPATEHLRTTIIDGKLNGAVAAENSAAIALPSRYQRVPMSATPPVAPLIRTAKGGDHGPADALHQLPPFIGRQAQLAALDLALQQAARGQCKVVMMSGELGIGKTRLWRTWAATLTAEQVVLETRCLNTTQAVPLDPVRRLVGSTDGRLHFARVVNTLLPVWRAELLHLAPLLQQDVITTSRESSSYPGALVVTASEERGLLAEALTQFLQTFAAKPLVLFLDDLHWADEATLNWLLYLTERMATEPLLLVGAYRPEDASPLLIRMVAQWQRDGLLQRMPLPHFTKNEAATLLTTLGRTHLPADELHLQSGGNPYYLTQLSEMTVTGIPATLAELVQARLGALPSALQPILQAAAVLEPAIDLARLCETSGRTEDDTLDALDGLLAAGILVERAQSYEFAHPLVATVVREALTSGRRKVLHRRAAEGLAARYAKQPALVAGPLARHYQEAGLPDEAARFAELAGEEALRMGAATEAVAFFRQAYALVPTPVRQLGVGRALMLLPGKLAEARMAMEQALRVFEAQGDSQGAIRAGLYLAGSYLSTSEGAQVLYWARRVLPDLETVTDPALHASAHNLMGTAKFRNGYSLSEAAAHYAEATRLVTAHKLETEIALMSWFEWGNLEIEAGDYPAAITKFQQAQRVAQAGHSVFFAALTLNNLAYATLLTGAVADAQALIDAGLALAETYALQSPLQYLYSTSGEIALAAGDLTAAVAAFQQALTFAEKFDNPTFAANVRAHLGRVAQARGALEEAYTLFSAAKATVTGDTARYLQCQLDLWLAELHIERGDEVAAEESLYQAAARLTNGQHRILQEKVAYLRNKLRNT